MEYISLCLISHETFKVGWTHDISTSNLHISYFMPTMFRLILIDNSSNQMFTCRQSYFYCLISNLGSIVWTHFYSHCTPKNNPWAPNAYLPKSKSFKTHSNQTVIEN